jgi:hypothetical protein
MIGSALGGLVGAMTVGALCFSVLTPPAGSGSAGNGVVVSGSQVVVVLDGDPAWRPLSADPLRCAPRAADPEPAAPFLALQRMLCALPTVPADVTRLTFPRTVPWLGLMHF